MSLLKIKIIRNLHNMLFAHKFLLIYYLFLSYFLFSVVSLKNKLSKIFLQICLEKCFYKLFIIVSFLFLTCCQGACFVEPKYTEEANRLYHMLGTYRVWLSDDEAYKIFGACYRKRSDFIYVSKNLYKKKYILVRFGEAITYEDENIWFGF